MSDILPLCACWGSTPNPLNTSQATWADPLKRMKDERRFRRNWSFPVFSSRTSHRVLICDPGDWGRSSQQAKLQTCACLPCLPVLILWFLSGFIWSKCFRQTTGTRDAFIRNQQFFCDRKRSLWLTREKENSKKYKFRLINWTALYIFSKNYKTGLSHEKIL